MAEIRVSPKRSDSWLDPESAGMLGWRLGRRLWQRIEGRQGRFITLTYDRSRYAGARECFDLSRERKHVSRFMRKLGQLLGMSLRGKWLCKMEFQAGGWVHWHIVLVDVGKIPRDKFCRLYDLWGHGSINVKPLTRENCKYLTKYVAKDGTIPGFVYDYPSGSIKVVRPSLGFWQDEKAERGRQRAAKREKSPRVVSDEYVPIGAKLSEGRADLRMIMVDDDGKVLDSRSFDFMSPEGQACAAPLCESQRAFYFGVALRRALTRYLGAPERRGRHLVYRGDGQRVCEAWALAHEEATGRAAYAGAGAPAAAGEQRGSATHLPPVGRPLFLRGQAQRARSWKVWRDGCWHWLSQADLSGKWRDWWAENAPWWVKLWWEQEARYEAGMTMHGEWDVWPGGVVSVPG